MTWTELNATDLTGVLQFPNTEFYPFWLLILFAFFTVVTNSTYFSEKQLTGRGNLISSLAISGVVTSVVALILNYMELIDRISFGIVVAIAIVFVTIYMLTEKF